MANLDDLLRSWSSLAVDGLRQRLLGPDSKALEPLLGREELNELRALAAVEPSPPAPGQQLNIVLLPGMMGSLLRSVEGLLETLWINPLLFTRGQINLLELAADGVTNAYPRVKVVASGLHTLSYASAVLLFNRRANLFILPYDWRHDLRQAAGLLHEALVRWSESNGYRRFTLVGHSLGGVIARTYLALFPAEAERLVQQVVLLASPLHGAPAAVEALASGHYLTRLADMLHRGNDGQRLLRSLTSVYQVLPPPQDLWPLDTPYPCDFDLYDAPAWCEEGFRQNGLDRARALYQLLATADPQVSVAQVAGYDEPTLVALRGAPDALQPTIVSEGPNSGDGTVPLWSAVLPEGDTYYVRCPHERIQKDRRVCQAVLDLAAGDLPDLPREIEPGRGPLIGADSTPRDLPGEAEQLATDIAEGRASAEDLWRLFLTA